MDIKERLKIDRNIMQHDRVSWNVVCRTEKLNIVRLPGLNASSVVYRELGKVKTDSMGYLKFLLGKNFYIDDIKLI